MQRPAVAPNVHRRARDERPQFGKVEFADLGNGAGERSEYRPRSSGHFLCRVRIGRAGRQDDSSRRIAARQCHNQRLERLRWPSAKRISCADVNHDYRVSGGDACAFQATIDRSRRGRVHLHLEGIEHWIGRLEPEGLQQVPLIGYCRTRSFVSWAWNDVRVHPRSPPNPITDTNRCAAGPCEPRRPRTAVQIDRNVEMLAAQAARERQVVEHPRQAASSRDDNDVSQITITANDRRGGRFDHIGEAGIRIPASKGTNERRREHYVTDQPQPD